MLPLLYLLSVPTASADPELTPEIQVRPRSESHTGRDFTSGDGETFFVVQRARLGLTGTAGQLKARVVLQDVRFLGEEVNTLDDAADGLDAHFAYLEWSTKTSGVRFGRQEFILHEQRLIGNLNWLQQARSFDGIKLWAGGEGWSADLSAAQTGTDQSELYEENAALIVGRAGLKGEGKSVADLVYILDASGDRERNVSTIGAYASGKSGALSGRAEGYYQLGSTDGLDVSAYFFGGQVTIAPEASLKPKITLWYDYMSGNGDDATVKGQFDTLYATNHKFYGLTDIAWFAIGGAADGRGLQDAALKAAISPTEQLTLKLEGHGFLAADGSGYIGAEPDLTFNYKATRNLSLQGGVGAFLPETGDVDVWGFLQANAAM